MSKTTKIVIIVSVCVLLIGLFILLYYLFGYKSATIGTTGTLAGLETVRRIKNSQDSKTSNPPDSSNPESVEKVEIKESPIVPQNPQPEPPKIFSGFTEREKKVAKLLVNLWETGEVRGRYDLLVVLDDGAGITFGRNQTTENSGGLSKLLKKYEEMGGLYNFSKFELYPSAKKFNMTNNEEFKRMLVESARNDKIMRDCQDLYFDENFFHPALQICEHFKFEEPLSLHFVYDCCIQHGPGSKYKDGLAFDRLKKWEDENLSEKEKVKSMCEKRHVFLGSINHAQKTRYRTQSILELMNSDKWKLETPLTFTFFKEKYLGYKDKVITITDEDL